MAKRRPTKFKIKKEFLIGDKIATEQVTQFCQRYDIDVDAMDDDQAKTAEGMLDALVEYTRCGYLQFEKDFSVTQILQSKYSDDIKDIKYKKISGKTKRAMDGFSKDEQYGKTYAVLGVASELGQEIIEELAGIDIKVAEVLGLLFLQ